MGFNSAFKGLNMLVYVIAGVNTSRAPATKSMFLHWRLLVVRPEFGIVFMPPF